MKAYIYGAALWCETCGAKLCADLPKPEGYDADNESTWDSDDYPKGPYGDGGGEADCPQHCDGCGVFLENPLTSHGRIYTLDSIRDHVLNGDGARDVIETWTRHYLGYDGLPAASFSYADLKAEYKSNHDTGDAWGCVMGAWHVIAAELYNRNEVPDGWNYRTGSRDPREPDSDDRLLSDPFGEMCALAMSETLIKFGNVLQRYSHKLRQAGKDY